MPVPSSSDVAWVLVAWHWTLAAACTCLPRMHTARHIWSVLQAPSAFCMVGCQVHCHQTLCHEFRVNRCFTCFAPAQAPSWVLARGPFVARAGWARWAIRTRGAPMCGHAYCIACTLAKAAVSAMSWHAPVQPQHSQQLTALLCHTASCARKA